MSERTRTGIETPPDGWAGEPPGAAEGAAPGARTGERAERRTADDSDARKPASRATTREARARTAAGGFVGGLIGLRRGPWEALATLVIALGVFMLMQPFVMWAYTYSFVTTLVGTLMFIVVSHFRE